MHVCNVWVYRVESHYHEQDTPMWRQHKVWVLALCLLRALSHWAGFNFRETVLGSVKQKLYVFYIAFKVKQDGVVRCQFQYVAHNQHLRNASYCYFVHISFSLDGFWCRNLSNRSLFSFNIGELYREVKMQNASLSLAPFASWWSHG